jgi:hypothetical protein
VAERAVAAPIARMFSRCSVCISALLLRVRPI